MKNTTQNYGWIAKSLHWVSAVVVIGMFASGWWMVELNYYSDWYRTAPFIHKSVGVLLLLLTLLRLCWKANNMSPDAVGNAFEQFMAKAAHTVLYLLIVVICVSGYLISTADGRGIEVFNWFVLPSFGELFVQQADTSGLIHKFSAYGLMGLVLLHALAALKHHFIDKDNTLKRML
ncbi:cytochrome b [Pseudoalteromonas phenolica]|uniref:Cytochrome b n=1 Tax=Pseudoalteromonas phenolica TaxID=161398 RepID=A0A5R9Q223_9GAMM|nr:cytochrome b [Pseudoalteromonas phenolica]TLX47213.1 cytochrome b [Pseudoalteromonas phenolica]